MLSQRALSARLHASLARSSAACESAWAAANDCGPASDSDGNPEEPFQVKLGKRTRRGKHLMSDKAGPTHTGCLAYRHCGTDFGERLRFPSNPGDPESQRM